MVKSWQSGCLRIECQEANGSHPLEDRPARLFIHALTDGQRQGVVRAEGQLGIQLAHLLHACIVLSSNDQSEWYVPTDSHPLHLRRLGQQVEIAKYPTYAFTSTSWLNNEDGLFLVDFGVLLESVSAAVEWVMHDIGDDYAEDDTVQVLVQQWERAWQRFSRLATFRRFTLAPVL